MAGALGWGGANAFPLDLAQVRIGLGAAALHFSSLATSLFSPAAVHFEQDARPSEGPVARSQRRL